jgi:hypothetical protein
MTLDPVLWEGLQTHGVTQAHLELLLRLLEQQRNGCFSWHFVRGQLSQNDLRLVFPNRSYEVQKVTEAVLAEGKSL